MQYVKLIGLKVNDHLGILKAFELQFDPNNRLVAVKGEVGSGKTTLQRSLRLGTQGSDTLKDDKALYGQIDQEVELLDGEKSVFIGCKTKADGSAIEYVLYQKDADGKKLLNPVIDGVKATPSAYLKSLQTSLTWRMNELTSENLTVQRKILLDLYKPELSKLGIIFDKADIDYSNSIMGRLDMAIQERHTFDILRKRNGGLATDLKAQGYDVEKPETLPTRPNLSAMNTKLNQLEFDLANSEKIATQQRETALNNIKQSASTITHQLKEINFGIREANQKLINQHKDQKEALDFVNDLISKSKTAYEKGWLNKDFSEEIEKWLGVTVGDLVLDAEIPFNGEQLAPIDDLTLYSDKAQAKILELIDERRKYANLQNSAITEDDNTSKIEEIELLKRNIKECVEVERICDAIDTFKDWQSCDIKVKDIRNELYEKLEQVDTGVKGLSICVDKENDSMDIYLAYNGYHDPIYFGNENKEVRKLSSYSGTQKPMICLLVQNYLLSRKEKAMRYIWIDDVPIDLKTQELLRKMAAELNLTVFVNITGDFSKESIQNGEILIDGGEVFFK